MSLAIEATLSAEFANSYVDVAYCDAYWSGHYSASKSVQWSALSSSNKITLLILACRSIESKRFVFSEQAQYKPTMRWDRGVGAVVEWTDTTRPVKADSRQALQFPRSIDRNRVTGLFFIPEAVMVAQCEQALHLLNFDDTAMASQMSGVIKDSLQVGDIKIAQEFSEGGSNCSTQVAPAAFDLLRPYLVKNGTILKRA